MPNERSIRDGAVEAATEVFRVHGHAGATLSLLSEATGLGRSSLYHHFPGGKAEIAAAVVARTGRDLDTGVLSTLRSTHPLPWRLAALSGALDELYRGGHSGCVLAALSLADDTRLVAATGHVFEAWIDALATAIEPVHGRDAARAAAEAAVADIQGALIVGRATGRVHLFALALERLRRLADAP